MGGARDSLGGFFFRIQHQSRLRGQAVEFHNAGVGGETTRGMLARAERVALLKPYDIVILLGGNDVPRENDPNPGIRTSLEEYVENLGRLLSMLRGERSLFLSSFAVSERLTGVSGEKFSEYMSAAIQVARAAQYDVWDLHSETKPFISNFWSSDGTHVTDQGHQFIMEGVSRWFF